MRPSFLAVSTATMTYPSGQSLSDSRKAYQTGREEQCLAQADILSLAQPELSQTWLLMANQWRLLQELDSSLSADF
jgi:hypothetical protein